MRTTLLAVSGSLRKVSYNTALIEALKSIAPAYIGINIFSRLGEMPLFNPDIEEQSQPIVAELKHQLELADGLIIASPEYAHGISGVMKNALDWLVSGREFVGKPVMLLNASPRATHAQAALREVIITMSGVIVESASIAVPLLGSKLDASAIAQQPELVELLSQALLDFNTAIHAP